MKDLSCKKTILAVAVSVALAACGGGSGTSSSGGNSVSTGVVTASTPNDVTVNGVTFSQTSARVSINDIRGSGDIKPGMTVKIRGSMDSATGTGVASAIEISHEVEGVIESISGATFVVNGQTITTDGGTLYDGITGGFSGLVAGMKVEVYGLPDANGIRATLVELEDEADFDDEVRGVVSNLTADTFMIGDLTIHYDSYTVFEDGTLLVDLINGAVVEVHLDISATMNHASKIEFEDNEDSEFEAHDGDEVEIEGYVNSHDGVAGPGVAGTFKIGDVTVSVSATTEYEGTGTLANNVNVEVEGTMVNGVLVATEVEYEGEAD